MLRFLPLALAVALLLILLPLSCQPAPVGDGRMATVVEVQQEMMAELAQMREQLGKAADDPITAAELSVALDRVLDKREVAAAEQGRPITWWQALMALGAEAAALYWGINLRRDMRRKGRGEKV